ncbi:MAG: head morphogenesis protein [Paracoccus denitrificans]|nr:MAG: head morphogenesis protein [Paracoccus denitrificans]PZO83655.1 MAG: head morphogenesis protein [Paracoccus denitrificans]
MEAIRTAINTAADFDAAGRALLELAARWTPDAFGTLLGDVLELAELGGREAVFADSDSSGAQFGVRFAEWNFDRRPFREQIDFLRQKRSKPTKVWTDAMQGVHDRAFVVAGVTDMAMLEEFHAAVVEGAQTYDIRAFGAGFDRLVAKYGWDYKGGRDWRIRTIFETNIRTSHMAGRLRQMRDPDMVKRMPYWQYVHAETRVPLAPRPLHVAWDGLVLRWDDPWWNVYFPPNDWRCSCGVRALSEGQLKRLGKTGPDTAPVIVSKPYTHSASGVTVQQPEGTGYGWDYMPGDLWERGLVPSALIDEGGGLIHEGRHKVIIDTPSPLADLLAQARPFAAGPMEEGLQPEDYVRAFLQPFGADIGQAVLWEDATGMRLPISDAFFRDRAGQWKVTKRGRAIYTPLMAETLMDPDEIWLGVAAKQDPVRDDLEELLIDRRYIRIDPEMGVMAVIEIGRRWWEPTTTYLSQDRKGIPNAKGIQARRGGKLLWKRK